MRFHLRVLGSLTEQSHQLCKEYERLFAEGQKRGEIRKDQKPTYLAEMMKGMLHTYRRQLGERMVGKIAPILLNTGS